MAAGFFSVGVGWASAAEVLDQNAINPPGFYPGRQITPNTSYLGYHEAGQTFTVGVAGLLSRIDVLIGGDDAYAVTMRIRNVTGGTADPVNANALATFNLISPEWGPTLDLFYSVTSIDVSTAGIMVDIGDTLAVTFDSSSGLTGNGGWAYYTGSYARGTGLHRTSPSASWNNDPDFAIATWVDTSPTAVPEPSSWVIMIAGVGAVGATMRRQAARRGRRAPPRHGVGFSGASRPDDAPGIATVSLQSTLAVGLLPIESGVWAAVMRRIIAACALSAVCVFHATATPTAPADHR
jgi:hypothetical protein